MQWLTTGPNPLSSATGVDAGQRGWKRHAIECSDVDTFKDIRSTRALCGLLPSHGWSLDLFIEDKCKLCVAKLRAKGELI